MKTGKRGARHRAVSIQIRVRVSRPRNLSVTKAFLVDAIKYRMKNGMDLPGITVTGIVWQKPNKTYYYDDEPRINRALYALSHMRNVKIDPSVFHQVRVD